MPGTDIFQKDRNLLIEYLEHQLMGPVSGGEEQLQRADKPHERYLMGALFPQGASNRKLVEEEDGTDTGASDENDNPISLAYQLKPASMGMSFYTRADNVRLDVAGAVYDDVKVDGKKFWKRRELASSDKPDRVELSKSVTEKSGILGGNAKFSSVWRPMGGGYLVTVTLINTNHADNNGRFRPEQVLHQLWMRCTPGEYGIEGYPSPNRYSWDEEEEELALVYRNKKTFGIGHGCAANWPVDSAGSVEWVETCYMPRYEVPPVTADFPESNPLRKSDAFSLQYLANPQIEFAEKESLLEEFIENYESWVKDQIGISIADTALEAAAERIAGRLNGTVERMRKGLKFLGSHTDAQQCFRLSNEAMLLQMVHSTKKYAGTLRDAGNKYSKPDYFSDEWLTFRWRPFQLAFQLLVVESIANRNSTDRDTVDLIWFPTGGGKTEAYLAAAAFELFYRRIKCGDAGGGTAVIKRYTLRLLTTQQFERAAALICACENIRQGRTSDFGDERFSLGLWVGGDTSPNRFTDAFDKYEEMLDQEKPENPFQLQRCPWCGTRIVPEEKEDKVDLYGVRVKANSFEFFCPESTCDFHKFLPVNVVDEHLYKYPPSFLVGTIDKFSRLAWADEPRAFFCGGVDGQRQPPSLVIQDELHLISGPLGTIAGLYEAAMDVVMQSAGGRPKYIAATATIRRAGEQGRRLYARDVSIFPPSGMSAEDSYFSREDRAKPGRMYIGIMGQYHTPVTSLVQTSAALAQAPCDLALNDDSGDGYWTQVIFHNSRRELGKTMTLSRDDIPERVKVIAVDEAKVRKDTDPVEMSANIPSRDIPVVLEQLGRKRGESGAVNIMPCTNMFSVGVDVQRLGLIVMNGQPKTTAEYIQASSRVGRGAVPGLVVAFYPNNKARDRSQYESFIPYHQALYRAVEPTSVTPYAIPAMERALHAALVIVMRYCAGLSGNDGAANFDKNRKDVDKYVTMLRDRMDAAERDDEYAKSELRRYLEQCIRSWHLKAGTARSGNIKLVYDSRGASNFHGLLAAFEPGMSHKPEIPWATLNSMRNVDQECSVYVQGEKK